MPHSSGGGSHGGGSHSSSHHSGSGSSSRTSTHYFPGARRYRRRRKGSPDYYFYTNSVPRKTGISGAVITGVFGIFITSVMGISVASDIPKKLDTPRSCEAAVHDYADVIGDEASLLYSLEEYQDVTGICPVVYTVYAEDWVYEYDYDLEEYTLDKYIEEFSDEDHFVFVYTLPSYQVEAWKSGQLDVPDFIWQAVQGDNTDAIITEDEFDDFREEVHEELEEGKDPGKVLSSAFGNAASRADRRINRGGLRRLLTFFPVAVTGLIFAAVTALLVRAYLKDRDTEYEEVPIEEGVASASYGSLNGSEGTSGSYTGTVKGIADFSKIIGVLITAIRMLSYRGPDSTGAGAFMLIFAIIWNVIVVTSFISMLKAFPAKDRKEPVMTAEYPKAQMPQADFPEPEGELLSDTTDYSVTDYDDDDYKRMKRRGYE